MVRKFRTSAAAQSHRQLSADWAALELKWKAVSDSAIQSNSVKKSSPYYKPDASVYQRDTGDKAPSLNSWTTGTSSSPPTTQYTGTAMVGVCTMHKSNMVPVFSTEDAAAIARMRR